MIRNIEIKDAPAVRKICEISLGYKVDVELVKTQIEKLLKNSNHFIIVYEKDIDKKVIGFVHAEVYECLYTDRGFNILGLAVLPSYQGQGIGSALMSCLEKEAIIREYKFVRLNSGEDRNHAHKFYEYIGYKCNKVQKRFLKVLY